MSLHRILRSFISPLLISIFILPCVPLSVRAQKGRPVIVNADQPNVWTLEQAHYLLEQMHRRNLDLRAKSLEDLDANAINGLRFDVLRLLVEAGASYNEASGFTNKLLKQNKEFDSQRRTQLISDRSKLRDESLQLTRDISDLQTQKVKATTQDEKDRLDAEIATKSSLRDKVDHEISLDDDELKTLSDASGDFKSTEPQVQFDKNNLPSSVFDDAFQATAKSLIDKFNQAPSLNASMTLNNFLDLQYEIVSKQLTSLRDEVGPGERLLFLELPQTVNVTHHEADNKWAQSWWRIAGYIRKPPVKSADDTRCSETVARSENCKPLSTSEKVEKILGTLAAPRTVKTISSNSDSQYVDLQASSSPAAFIPPGSNIRFDDRSVRTVELVPREGSLNVNDMKLRTHAGVFSFVASFLFGFGAKLNVERQREQFSQFVQQELYSSAFGKGAREFGWTFMPMPGTDRLLSGVRTTYAAVVVPDKATALVLQSNGCFFPRAAYEPNDFTDTLSPDWNKQNRRSRNCTLGKAFLVPIPVGENGTNSFWIRRVSYQPVKKGERIVVSISGSNFSSQIGVLVNGVPLTPAVGLAQPLIRDDSKAQSSALTELKDEKVRGRIERVDANRIVFSFEVDDFEGTPTITLIAPGKAIDINWLDNIGVNQDDVATLSENPDHPDRLCGDPKTPGCIQQAVWMFGERPKAKSFGLDSLEVFRLANGKLRALIHGRGFRSQTTPPVNTVSSVYISGVSLGFYTVSSSLLEVPDFPAPPADSIQATLVTANDTATSNAVANPGFPKIAAVSIVSYEAETEKKAGILVVRLEGTGFPAALQSDNPKRIKVTVTSSTEAFLTITNPNQAELLTLSDRNTNITMNVMVTRKPPPK